jgi:hypothetical protein
VVAPPQTLMGAAPKPKRATPPVPGTLLWRRLLLSGLLLAAVAALAVFVWYRATTEKPDPRPPLTQVPAEAVQSIEITRPNQAPIVLARHEGGWRLLSPVKARVNRFAVDRILRTLKAPSEGQIAVDSDLSQYGLKRPALTARFDGTAIDIGALHPLKDLHYVRVNGAVHLIPSLYYGDLARSYGVYLDMLLIEERLKPVVFRLPGFTLAQKDGVWQRKPENPALSSDRINAFVEDWRRARAINAERYAQQPVKEHVSISFQDENGKRSTLIIGVLQREPELLLLRTDEGLVYQFPASAGQRLLTLEEAPAK